MLTLFFGDSAKAFQRILTHFVNPPAKILDLTYGNGNSWKGFEFNTLNGKYELMKCDIRKEKNIDLQIDIRKPLPNEFTECFDCVYFDPPYYFKETIKEFEIQEPDIFEETTTSAPTNLASNAEIEVCMPMPIDIRVINKVIPIVIPKIVKKARNFLLVIDLNAIFKDVLKITHVLLIMTTFYN